MKTEADAGRRKDKVYHVILIIFAFLVCMVSLTDLEIFTLLNVREMGILAFGFVDVFFLIRLIIEKEEPVRKRFFHLFLACIATVIYMMYCKDILFDAIPGNTNDELNISGMLCVLFVFVGKERMCKNVERS